MNIIKDYFIKDYYHERLRKEMIELILSNPKYAAEICKEYIYLLFLNSPILNYFNNYVLNEVTK